METVMLTTYFIVFSVIVCIGGALLAVTDSEGWSDGDYFAIGAAHTLVIALAWPVLLAGAAIIAAALLIIGLPFYLTKGILYLFERCKE